MNKKNKLNEAKYFFSQMENSIKDHKIFEYNLSAFLCASRSILQYSFNEVEKTPREKWYKNFVSSSPLIKYFKDKRDTNIHFIPVKTSQRHEYSKVLSLPLTASIRTINKDEDALDNSTNENILKDSSKSEYKMVICFKDWSGGEDVLELCKKYLTELMRFLNEGITKKYITN